MKAIETIGKIDKDGLLHVSPFKEKNRNVKVIVLVPESDEYNESEWLKAISENPSFSFLKEPYEDIYSNQSGKPFNG